MAFLTNSTDKVLEYLINSEEPSYFESIDIENPNWYNDSLTNNGGPHIYLHMLMNIFRDELLVKKYVKDRYNDIYGFTDNESESNDDETNNDSETETEIGADDRIYHKTICLNDILYFGLLDKLPYKYIKRYFEQDINKDEYEYKITIEGLDCNRPAYCRVRITLDLLIDANPDGSTSIYKTYTVTKELEYSTSSGIAYRIMELIDDESN